MGVVINDLRSKEPPSILWRARRKPKKMSLQKRKSRP